MDPILNVLKVAMPTPPEINVGARSMRAPGSTTYDRMHGWCGEVNIESKKRSIKQQSKKKTTMMLRYFGINALNTAQVFQR